MKTRLGFVSNSSASSFCIFGAAFHSLEELAQDLKIQEPLAQNGCEHDFDRLICRFCPECGKPAFDRPKLSVQWIAKQIPEELMVVDKRYVGYEVYVGRKIEGEGQKLIDSLKKVNELTKKLFGQEASVHQGVYEGM